MDIFESHYFSVNRIVLRVVGLWLYQDKFQKSVIQTLFVLNLIISLIPHIYGMHKNSGELYKTLVHAIVILYTVVSLAKYVTTIAAEKKLNKVFKLMINNWNELNEKTEQKILNKYSARGKTLVVFYSRCIVLGLILYIGGPLTPIILNKVHPLENGTRLLIYVLYGEYGVDPVEHYYKIFIIESLFCIVPGLVVCAVDIMYVSCIEHCLALFAVVKHRLQLSTKRLTSSYNYTNNRSDQDVHNVVINIIKLHQRIIDFANQLESSYSTSFLFLITLNGMYITVLSVLIIQSTGDSDQIRFIAALIAVVLHLFYISWPGQKMINYSTGLFSDVYSNEWYKCSIRTQNLMKFMTLRCITPCQLTAGGIYVMNFTNFATIVKTSVSYIAVLASFA